MPLLGWRALLLLAGCSALARGYTLRCPAPRTRLDALTAPHRPSSMRLVHPQMNLGDRFMRLVKSNVNNLISNMEDPEKVLTQAVDDMQRDLIKVRQAYAEVSASTKRMEGQLSLAEQEADKWYSRAQLALEKGEEELAREALTRRQQQVEMADGLKEQIESQQGSIASLFESMKELEVKCRPRRRAQSPLGRRRRPRPRPHHSEPRTRIPRVLSGPGEDDRGEGEEGSDHRTRSDGEGCDQGERHALWRWHGHLHSRVRPHDGEG